MKKLSIRLVFLLIGLILVSSTALAETTEKEDLSVELTKGEIEFKTIFFNNQVNNWHLNNDDVVESEKDFLSIEGGNRRLEAEFAGKAFKDIDWKLLIEEKDNNAYNDIVSLAFAKEFNNSLVELAFYDGLEDIAFKAKKELGKVEAQSIISIKDTWTYINKEDIYIKYNFSDQFNMSFKPHKADFTISDNKDEKENRFVKQNQFTKELDTQPGIEANYQLSDEITLNGSFWTTGHSKSNQSGVEGKEETIREIQLKAALDYKKEDISFAIGSLINTHSKTFSTDENAGEFEEKGIETSSGRPEQNFRVNALGEYKAADDLTIEGEAKLGLGKYENEKNKVEKSLMDFGLYTKATKELDSIEVYSSYKFERLAYEYEDIKKITETTNTITAGAEKPLEEGLILTGEISLAPSSVKNNPETGDTITNNFLSTTIMTGLRYEF